MTLYRFYPGEHEHEREARECGEDKEAVYKSDDNIGEPIIDKSYYNEVYSKFEIINGELVVEIKESALPF